MLPVQVRIIGTNEAAQQKADEKKAEIIQIDPRKFEDNELTLADFAADIEYIPLSNKLQIGFTEVYKLLPMQFIWFTIIVAEVKEMDISNCSGLIKMAKIRFRLEKLERSARIFVL